MTNANYGYRNDGDNVRLNIAEGDLDLGASLVRALIAGLKDARAGRDLPIPPTPTQGLDALLDVAFGPTAPRSPKPKRLTKKERAERDARLAMRRAALEELKADSARLLAEREAKREARKVAKLLKVAR